jgi:hypothetical protein
VWVSFIIASLVIENKGNRGERQRWVSKTAKVFGNKSIKK